jgi:phytoene desaturase
MKKKKIIIIGAGPGGLTSGMILSHRGFDVEIYEKDSEIGGRNKAIKMGGFTFDTGPTFLMLKFILEDMFKETGRKATDYLEFKLLDPMYKLQFKDNTIFPTSNKFKMKEQIKKVFPGNENGFEKFLKRESARFENLFPCLQKDYSSFKAFFSPIFLKAIPHLSLTTTVYQNLSKYFNHEDLKIAFTFQAKYLGMSPWKCPGLFTMLSYIEYNYGVYHVMGGLNQICEQMAKIIKEENGVIHLNSKVKELILEGKKVKGVLLENGEKKYADDVIINADFSYAMTHLIPDGILKKYSKQKLKKKKYSCATFMLYLGLKKNYNLNHHNILFADDYKKNVDTIFNNQILGDDFSIYIQNACVTDPSLAPSGKSTFYVLVPIANNRSGIDWQKEKEKFKNKVIDLIIKKTGFTDLRENIEVEKIITPREWENDYNVYIAAEFNLAHTVDQMLYFRPRNKFEELENCYLVGGGTHPGSGLPTIYESGRITSNLISKKYQIPFNSPSNISLDQKIK